MFCKQRYPNILEVGDSWVNAQQVLLGRIAAAQWAAYDAIRTKTGAVLDRVDHSNEQVPFDEYEEGHVQPWMTGKLVLAIRDAVFESLADIGKHTLKDLDASIYESFSFGGLGPVYDRPNRARFPCSCKAHEVNLIIEKEIDLAHHRINVGTIKLLKEDNAIENAENRARRHITNAAQDDMDVIIEENDEVQKCRPGDETHMEAWSTFKSPFFLCPLELNSPIILLHRFYYDPAQFFFADLKTNADSNLSCSAMARSVEMRPSSERVQSHHEETSTARTQ